MNYSTTKKYHEPNFFLIGAPKCGTTSMASWLSDHPQVFMTDPKEPMYFSKDITMSVKCSSLSWEYYHALYQHAGAEHVIRGEASTFYLESSIAVPSILAIWPEAKFLVMARNPIEQIQSIHNQELFNLNENVQDFWTAWNLQELRSQGYRIPSTCTDPYLLLYGERGKLGHHLQRVRSYIDDVQLKVVFLDDLQRDPQAVYKDVLHFLGISDDGRKDFTALNKRHLWKSYYLCRLGHIIGKTKRLLGIRKRFGLLNPLLRWNNRTTEKKNISADKWAALAEYFSDDIELLAKQCERDLSHCLEYPGEN